VLACSCLYACSDPERERLKATTKPAYDRTTGKLTELTYDANKNGRVDTWTAMDGSRALSSRIDRDEDGKIDRWEYYADNGQLAKVDAWVFAGGSGNVQRIEISSAGDEKKIDRWEFYDESVAMNADGTGALLKVEEDTNGDGKLDKWETYEQGVVKTAAFDENGDGAPDRRLTYEGATLVLVESVPDANGKFTKRVAVK
jgi:hypothetical protein